MCSFWVTKAKSHPNILCFGLLSKPRPGTTIRPEPSGKTASPSPGKAFRERGLPLRGGVLAVERVLQLDDVAVLLPQQPLLLGVVLHQLCQRGELLAAVQVIVIPRVLDLNVRHLIVSSEEGRQTSVREWKPSAGLQSPDAS